MYPDQPSLPNPLRYPISEAADQLGVTLYRILDLGAKKLVNLTAYNRLIGAWVSIYPASLSDCLESAWPEHKSFQFSTIDPDGPDEESATPADPLRISRLLDPPTTIDRIFMNSEELERLRGGLNSKGEKVFTANDNYTMFNLGGTPYEVGLSQGLVIKVLHRYKLEGSGEVKQATIFREARLDNAYEGQMTKLFKEYPDLFGDGKLVSRGNRGSYYLNLS